MATATMTDAPAPDRPTQAFSYPGFRYFWLTTLCSSFAAQIMAVAIGWQIYDMTRNPLYLGLVGLAHFLPALLPLGRARDRAPVREP